MLRYLINVLLAFFKLAMLIGVFGGAIYWIGKRGDDREREAQAKLEPYNNQIAQYLRKNSVAKKQIPAKGNVIIVDEKTKRLDKLSDYTIIPYNRPKNPSEVDSVILRNCEYVQVGSYGNGIRAMQHICDFTVIDIATGTWSNWGEFKGTPPEEKIERRRGSSADENGGNAIYSFWQAGGFVTTKVVPQ